MEEKILQLITEYGLEATILALAINLFTGLIKMPIKAWAKKRENGRKATRFLVFLPVVVGLLLTFVYLRAVYGKTGIDKPFVTLWVSSSSLSLALYAFWEKLFPAKEKMLTEPEIEANKKLLEKIKEFADKEPEGENPQSEAPTAGTTEEEKKELASPALPQPENAEDAEKEKIVLRGKKDENAETEKKSV